MEKTHKNEMGKEQTLFWGGEVSVNAYAVQMVLHHLLDGILQCTLQTVDQRQVWSCEHTGKISLLEYCRNHDLSGNELRWIGKGILANLLEVQDYLLENDQVYLDPAEIYLDLKEEKVWNCYIPFYQMEAWKNLQNLSQFFLGHINQKDPDAVSLAYQLFRYLRQSVCNTDDLWEMFCEAPKVVVTPIEKLKVVEMPEEDSIEDNPIEGNPIESNPIENGSIITKETRKPWSPIRWIVGLLPIVAAVFIGIYVAMNEWYLSVQMKLLLLIGMAIFVLTGVLCLKKWKTYLKKENPLEKGVGSTGFVEKQNEIYEYEIEAKEGDWDVDASSPSEDIEHTGEILLNQEDLLHLDEEMSENQMWGRLIQQDTEEELVLSDNPSVVGKIPEVARILLNSPYVSRIHGKLWMEQGEYYIEDLNSKNGTYLNGVRLEPQKPARLQGNDELAFANMRYYFQL